MTPNKTLGAYLGIAALGLGGLALLNPSQSKIQSSPAVSEYHTCIINGVAQRVVPPCEEIQNFYTNTVCPFEKENWTDMDCGDFDSQSDAQFQSDKEYICFGYDLSDLDRDDDGVACEEML